MSRRPAVAHVATVAFDGIEVREVDVQVHLGSGLAAFNVVGLPDKAVAESRERVRAALAAIGLGLPAERITVNLAPADILKEGSHFDLPIALGLLAAMGAVQVEDIAGHIALGELGLDGALTEVAGVLSAAMSAVESRRGLVCPAGNGPEAAWAGDLEVLAPKTLLALLNHFRGRQLLAPPEPGEVAPEANALDLHDIKGQETAKRALEIAAAGSHNLLFCGPPGAGKSMLAARLPGLLPLLQPVEALEVSRIHSAAGALEAGRIPRRRPFRDPHHSSSMTALVGGGQRAAPGEISLAHRGVLFLDELPEFDRRALEALRQPLEVGRVSIARANRHVVYPARFQLVAAMNPCRCGHIDEPDRACNRAPRCAADYRRRLSGPLLDRFDLFVDVPRVAAADLALPPPAESSRHVAARVDAVRERQAARYGEPALNGNIDGARLVEAAAPDEAGRLAAAKRNGAAAAFGSRLPPRAPRRAHAGGHGRQPRGGPPAYRGGAELPPGARGLTAVLPAQHFQIERVGKVDGGAVAVKHPAAHADALSFQRFRREGARDAPALEVNGEVLAPVIPEIDEIAAEAARNREHAPLHQGKAVENRSRAPGGNGPRCRPRPEAGFGQARQALQPQEGERPLARDQRRGHRGEAARHQLPLQPERAGKHMREAPAVPVEAGPGGFVAQAGPGQEGGDEGFGAFQQAHIGRFHRTRIRKGGAGEQDEQQGGQMARHGRLEALQGGR